MTQTSPRPLTRFSVVDLTTVRSGPTLSRVKHRPSRTPGRVERAAPMTGEPTHEILATLGYDAATLDTLLAEGAIEQCKGETP